VCVLACDAAAAAAAAVSPGRLRVGSAPVLPAGSRVSAAVPSSTRLDLTVALKPQDPNGLAAYATEVSTPGSPLFRNYLTVEEFAQRFGAAPAQIAAVGSALKAQGLRVGAVAANDLTIPVHGTAAQVENAFSVSLSQVKLASGRSAYANVQAPTLQSSIGRYVQGVIGLDDVTPPQPAGVERMPRRGKIGAPGAMSSDEQASTAGGSRANIVTGGPQPCAAALNAQVADEGLNLTQVGIAGFPVTADQVASAYQFSNLYSAGDLGAGQTVAVFEQQPYDPSDIGAYAACYGIAPSVSNVDVDGGPGPYQPPSALASAGTASRRSTSSRSWA